MSVSREAGLRILSAIAASVDPMAIAAGGFARDLALGRPAKDIDIYVHVAGIVDEDAGALFDDAFRTAGFERCYLKGYFDKGETSTEGDFNDRLDGCLKFSIDGIDVDILFFPEPIDADAANVFASFDVGLCMAGIRADGTELRTLPFNRDLLDGTLTIMRESIHASRMVSTFFDRAVRMEVTP